jgi:hypothetical protein
MTPHMSDSSHEVLPFNKKISSFSIETYKTKLQYFGGKSEPSFKLKEYRQV